MVALKKPLITRIRRNIAVLVLRHGRRKSDKLFLASREFASEGEKVLAEKVKTKNTVRSQRKLKVNRNLLPFNAAPELERLLDERVRENYSNSRRFLQKSKRVRERYERIAGRIAGKK
ncbi:MAG: hypothetical protein WC602_02500 [archaeon]